MNSYGSRPFDDEPGMASRDKARDSLFMQARLAIGGSKDPVTVRVRNLSPGGMLAETLIVVETGARVIADLPNVGEVPGRIVWAGSGKFGIAFDLAVDPQAVRRRIGKDAVKPTTLTSLGPGLDQAPFRRR